ncbi:GIY-YIG nuclease family protein [Gammaproteobacteria bacterium]|nr:GIY-YIG nuclease family protein [Gammaproteobacteria bacterium]MDC0590706.1 GIY-YIG nuclease family protein [Gammaproteobacteria bacterium]|tara:strand:- start:15 stop:275 length:261 start_codon:yes stop_codon:yes gene_type:complete
MSWAVYILECSDGSFYTGISNNVEARINTHNASKGAKYTKSRLPVTLVFQENTFNKSESLRREIEIKKLTRKKKRELIDTFNFPAT